MDTQRRIGPEAIAEAIDRIARQLADKHPDPNGLLVAGIANGGVPFGELLAARLGELYGQVIPVGSLNITFHRDDLEHNPIPGEKFRTELPMDVDGVRVILADDVIFSGRSARAALAELHDLGRPSEVRLVVLFDRGLRKLPIQPDASGFAEALPAASRVTSRLSPARPGENELLITPS